MSVTRATVLITEAEVQETLLSPFEYIQYRLSHEHGIRLEHAESDPRLSWYAADNGGAFRVVYDGTNGPPSTQRLAKAMFEAGVPRELVTAAKRGYFDDFHENGHPTPQIALVKHLRAIGTPACMSLVTRVREGEFDGQAWESKAWAHRQTGELHKIIDKLGL